MTTKFDAFNFDVDQILAPNTYTSDTTSGAIDTQGFEAVTFVVNMGVLGDTAGGAYFDCEVQASDDTVDGNFAAVPATSLSDTVESGVKTNVFAHIDDTLDGSRTFATGYLGTKRYVRLKVDFDGTHSTGTKLAASVIKSKPHNLPQ